MDDNRIGIMGGSNLWIWIILAFLLFSNMNRGGTGIFGGGLDCAFPNLFGGCNSSWVWIILAVLAFMFLNNDCAGGIFRSEIQ